ncbi:MAG TPA: hypothetical protein HPQ00_12200 [Magnetococcales bacterium]|nr:hypothetical protein [Magnetococcales bacterium]
MAERKKIYEEMHPQTKAGVAGANAKHCGSENIDKTGGSANAIVAFAEITAEKLKLSRRTVESALRMHRDLSPESKTAIAGTWLARSGKDLELLSRQSPETQERVLRLIDSVPDMARPGGVAMALNRTQGKSEPASGATKTIREFDALLKIWAATHAPARQLFIEHLKEKEGVCDKKKDDEVQ